ncbi:Modification methylase PvuII [Shewanella khirikhana]|uniref:Methyltransferase n=2 Tax=Shewanella khirikhana TaxID=1965282 RepID=A0ABN5TNH9_9GAMM|nr:Modification methylase PvuII [Shewanella khirikhana]
MAPIFSRLLTDDGSVVIELGNSWEPKRPVQSLLPLESLMGFVKNEEAGFRLCQQFICYNPSRLPSPAPWVTQKRIRATDSYTNVWWMSKSDFPKADNSKVLRPYSKKQKQLQAKGSYNAGKRPSEHDISETGFLKDNGGSIAHNFFELEVMDSSRDVRLPNSFAFSNTSSNDYYHRKCRDLGIIPHPARMPEGLAAFFIQMLTDENDLVLDPFGGSNTTGYTAQTLGRRWISIEAQEEYLKHSKIRFSQRR